MPRTGLFFERVNQMSAIISDSDFEAGILRAPVPVLVRFAPAPDEASNAVLGEVADALAGRALVTSIDNQTNSELAARYDATGAPILVIFDKGKPVTRRSDLPGKDELVHWMEHNGVGCACHPG